MKLQGQGITVFCASSPGHDPRYLALARELGRGLAERGATVVYGGAGIGLMGASSTPNHVNMLLSALRDLGA